MLFRSTTANNGYTNFYGGAILDVYDYTDTHKAKSSRAFTGFDYNGTTPAAGALWYSSGLWTGTSNITSLTLATYDGTNFRQNSTFALYGVK